MFRYGGRSSFDRALGDWICQEAFRSLAMNKQRLSWTRGTNVQVSEKHLNEDFWHLDVWLIWRSADWLAGSSNGVSVRKGERGGGGG